MKHKKDLNGLSDKDKRRLKIRNKSIQCCSNPKPVNQITELFEPYITCGNCGEEIF